MSFIDKLFKQKTEAFKKAEVVRCPYCDFVLSKAPLSKTKCKNCKNFIYVRTHFVGGKKLYLTEKQKDIFDGESRDFYFQKKWLRKFSQIGINENNVEEARTKLTKKWGVAPSFNDLAWSLFNRQVIELGKNGTLHQLKMLYFDWALFTYEIDRNPNDLLKQAHKFGLLEYKRGGFIKKVQILSNRGCDECQKLNGKVFSIDELLKENNILPNKKCTRKIQGKTKYSWCTCMFQPVIDMNFK